MATSSAIAIGLMPEVIGVVYLQNGSEELIRAELGMEVFQGQEIDTRSSGPIMIGLINGKVLTLG